MTDEQRGQEPERPDWQSPTPPPMPPPPEYGGAGYAGGPGYGPGAGGPGYGGGGGYGTGPGYAGGPGYGGFQPMGQQAGPPPPVPSTLDTAWWLVIANVVLGLIGLVYTVSHRQEIIDRVIQTRDLDPELARSAANVGIAVGVLFGIGFAIFYVFLAVKMRAGRNWARITLTVFLSLGVLGGLANTAGANPSFSKLVAVIGLLLNVATLILIWLRPSNEYIAARNRT
jgi:hypothetical protein